MNLLEKKRNGDENKIFRCEECAIRKKVFFRAVRVLSIESARVLSIMLMIRNNKFVYSRFELNFDPVLSLVTNLWNAACWILYKVHMLTDEVCDNLANETDRWIEMDRKDTYSISINDS